MLAKLTAHAGRNLVAYLALFVALGGTAAEAAVNLPRNSVGTAQLKPNAVVSAKVKDHSLLARDFASGELAAGPAGPTGPAGPPASRLWAVVKDDGAIVRQVGGVTGVLHTDDGTYTVNFNQDISNCAWEVSPTNLSPTSELSTATAATNLGSANTIRVTTTDGSDFLDEDFTIAVFC